MAKKKIIYLTVCHQKNKRRLFMLRWALFFFIVSLIAGLLGFTGISGTAAEIAKFIFVCFLAICTLLILGSFFLFK